MTTEEWAFRLPRKAERIERLTVGARRARVVFRATAATLITLAFVTVMAVFVPTLFGYKVMAVTSGSMAPSIHVGDAIYVRQVEEAAPSVDVGDVISYRNLHKAGTTTHRVIAVKSIDGHSYFQTKGEANLRPDVDLIPAEAVYGIVGLRVPGAGPALAFATGRWGKLALLGLPALALMASEIARILQRRRSPQKVAPKPVSRSPRMAFEPDRRSPRTVLEPVPR